MDTQNILMDGRLPGKQLSPQSAKQVNDFQIGFRSWILCAVFDGSSEEFTEEKQNDHSKKGH
jgi:hypothetical protein